MAWTEPYVLVADARVRAGVMLASQSVSDHVVMPPTRQPAPSRELMDLTSRDPAIIFPVGNVMLIGMISPILNPLVGAMHPAPCSLMSIN